MATEKTLIIADGENLSARYREMLSNGRVVRQNTVAISDYFVWNPGIFGDWLWSILRISYHTSITGDDLAIQHARHAIGAVQYKCRAQAIGLHDNKQMYRTSEGRIVPSVRKRASKSRKESICDTAIAVEALRASYRDQAQKIVILSGDGDFLPLYQELMHSGREVIVGAFSSGLHADVPICVDSFIDLDPIFFEDHEEA